MTNWVDIKKHGPPDEEGRYLVTFNDDTMEAIDYDPHEFPNYLWQMPLSGCKVTHWAELPEKPSPEDGRRAVRRQAAIIGLQAQLQKLGKHNWFDKASLREDLKRAINYMKDYA